jgi:DNA polymerase elongation subunit (family B)
MPLHLPAQVLAGLVPLNKFIITKQLTKRPDDYPDAKNQPHVQVALRRRAAGKQNGVMAVSEQCSCCRAGTCGVEACCELVTA